MTRSQDVVPPLSTRLCTKSAKIRFFESLFLWNQGVDQIVSTLHHMESFPFTRKKALQYAQAQIEEIRADVNADFMEELGDRELDDAGRFSKQRRAYEKKREDPDDVYIDVLHREEERKRQGLPPRVGIVPYSAVADEEERIHEEHSRKQRRKNGGRHRAKAKRVQTGKNHA